MHPARAAWPARPLLALTLALLLQVLLLARPAEPLPAAGAVGGRGAAAPPPAAGARSGAPVPFGAGGTRTVAGTAAAGWRAPVAGAPRVLRPFAPGPHRWSPGHRGVDLALAAGDPVLAAGRGRVVFSGPVAGRGVVSVAHGHLRTTYEPVRPLVTAGDLVQAGTALGVLAPGHAPCGTCLHWGLRRGDDYLDPLRLLRPARVRLLPLSP